MRGLNWKPGVIFSPNFSWSVSARTENCYVNFLRKQLSFSQNQPMKFEILTLLAWFNQIGTFFPGLNFKPGVSLPPTFHGLSVSEQVTAMSSICSRNLSFSQNQPMKFGILTLFAWFNEIGTNFPMLNWKPGVSFHTNFSWAFSITA